MPEGNRQDRDRQLRRIAWRRWGPLLLAVMLLLPGTGCATLVRLGDYPESPQVLGGLRSYDGLYEELGYVNVQGLNSGIDFLVAVFAVDLLATIALDLLLLPITIPTAFASGSPSSAVTR